jgi:hypothetical protein
MNDRYVADIGDWAKFRVLRSLLAAAESVGTNLQPAVLWWKTKDPGGADGDGRHTAYLSHPAATHFAPIDPELHARLKRILDRKERTIQALERSGIMPAETVYHSEPLDFPQELPARGRGQWRREWVQRAGAAAQAATLIFADPDNGLAPTSASRSDRLSHKRVWIDELGSIVSTHQSLVLYHHAHRSEPAAVQGMLLYERLLRQFPTHAPARLLLFRRLSLRFFAIVPSIACENVIHEAVRRLTDGIESTHFELMLRSIDSE